MCRNLAYDCVMKDCIHMDNSPSILRKDGFEFLYDKYKDKIYKDMEQMAKDLGLDGQKEVFSPVSSNRTTNMSLKIIYIFLTIFLYLLKCPQSLILSALRAFCFCGKPHISRSIFLYFRYQAWLKSW